MKILTKVLASSVVLGLLAGPALAQDSTAAPDPVLAVVDEHEIRQSDLVSAIGRLPEQFRQLPPQQLFPALLEQLISQRLVINQGVSQDLATDDEVEARFAEARESITREAELQIAAAHDGIIQDVYLSNYLQQAVPEAAVRARYDETIGTQAGEDEVHARHILLESEEDANAVIEELAGGADFATLAEERSTGPSGPQGGDLGFFTSGRMVPEFATAAFAMAIGDVSETPVETQFGWHVIKVEDRRTTEPPSFEASRSEIEVAMRQEAVQAHVEDLRAEAAITRFNPDGTPIEAAAPPAAN